MNNPFKRKTMNNESNKPTTTGTKEQPKSNEKPLSGTGEKPWWEKIADSVSDNKLMNGGVRFLLNPLVIITGVIGAGYWLYKMKEEATLFKQENEKLKQELGERKHYYRKLKKKHKKLKKLKKLNIQIETQSGNNIKSLGFIPQQSLPMNIGTTKTYQTAYLD